MTPVVIDASAGVELVADTVRGRALQHSCRQMRSPGCRRPSSSKSAQCYVGGICNAILTPDQISEAIRQLAVWPLRIVQVRALFADAWRLRKNLTFADATYVALAEHLGAKLLTDDHKLANAPTLSVPVLRLPIGP